jgi:aspartyl-tRNA synthetase
VLAKSEFKVFAGALSAGGSVRGINVKNAYSKLTRKEIDKLTAWTKDYGAKGLAWTRLTPDAATSSFEKFLSPDEVTALRNALDAETGDVMLIVADSDNDTVFASLGALRCELAGRLGLIPENSYDLLWVTDFPQFEYDAENNRYAAKHHPFTAPKDEDIDKLDTDQGSVRAKAYDLVLNGCEVGGGSIRINNPELQSRMFKALGFTEEAAREQFGFLLDAFKYGAPPHGGMAYGLDRLCMLLTGSDSIREVMAFPKVQNASELMTECPSKVDPKQLGELGIFLIDN